MCATMSLKNTDGSGRSIRAKGQAPAYKGHAAGSSLATPSKRPRKYRKITALQRRQIRCEPGLQKDVAKKFGVSPNYVCILKSGVRPIHFTPVEIMGGTLISMAFGATP